MLARYVGGDAAVLSGLMSGADEIRQRPFAVDVPGGYTGKGRVVLFANNPIYRWQNHGEFNMVFNSMLNWNDLGKAGRRAFHAGHWRACGSVIDRIRHPSVTLVAVDMMKACRELRAWIG